MLQHGIEIRRQLVGVGALCFHQVAPGAQTQAIGLGRGRLYPLCFTCDAFIVLGR